jgi:hypothetical protein
VNEQQVRQGLTQLALNHSVALAGFGTRQSQLLEVAGLLTAAQHYRAMGYRVEPRNLKGGLFRSKVTTSFYPQRYSYFEISRDMASFEIHSNMPIKGEFPLPTAAYVVDIAVVRPGKLPPPNIRCIIESRDLITFAEVKALIVYPMLLAQFIGIVHEITPRFLNGRVPYGFRRDDHFRPALITIEHLRPTSKEIVDSFSSRGFKVKICPGLDNFVARRGWTTAHESILAIGTSDR